MSCHHVIMLSLELLDPATLWMSAFFAVGLLWTNEYMTHINAQLKDMGDGMLLYYRGIASMTGHVFFSVKTCYVLFMACFVLCGVQYSTIVPVIMSAMCSCFILDSDDAMKHTFILIVSLLPIALSPLVDRMQHHIKCAGTCAVCTTLLM